MHKVTAKGAKLCDDGDATLLPFLSGYTVSMNGRNNAAYK